jgi:hypothetical protein
MLCATLGHWPFVEAAQQSDPYRKKHDFYIGSQFFGSILVLADLLMRPLSCGHRVNMDGGHVNQSLLS